MKKNIFTVLLLFMIITMPAFSGINKNTEEYLKDKKHFAVMNPVAESVAQSVIKKQIKKETGAKFKVKFVGYTLSSMKEGIFKYLEITGKKIIVEDVFLPYINVKTISDYNWVDYNQNPVVFKTDMDFAYTLHLSERSINDALKNKDYQNVIKKVNRVTYPVIAISGVSAKIKENKLFVTMEYYFPLKSPNKKKTFTVHSGLNVVNGKITAKNVGMDKSYGSVPIDKVTSLLNIIDPLSFTLDLVKNNKCDGNIENVKIVDDIIVVNGKIFIKGSK